MSPVFPNFEKVVFNHTGYTAASQISYSFDG